MKISVIVYDHGYREKFHFLPCITNQTLPKDEYEVIWVEYYGKVREEVTQYETQYENFKVIILNRKDLWHEGIQINEAVRQALGEVLFIIDGDVLVRPTFLESIWKEHQKESRLALYMKRYNEPVPPTGQPSGIFDWDELEKICVYDNPRNYGACLTIHRDWFWYVGGMDESPVFASYGNLAIDMQTRLENAGMKTRFHEDEIMLHPWHPGSGHGHNAKQEKVVQRRKRLGIYGTDDRRLVRIRYIGYVGEGSVGDDVVYAAFQEYIENNLRIPAKLFIRKPYLSKMRFLEERNYDFHIVGGGTCLSPMGREWVDKKAAKLADWNFPFCLYSVSGVNEQSRGEYAKTKKSLKMLDSIARKSLFSSVRDSEAYSLLKKGNAKNLSLDGDATFYFVKNLYRYREKPSPEPRKIGLVLADVRPQWLGVYEFDKAQVIEEIKAFCVELLAEGYRVEPLLFNTSDKELYAEFAKSIGISFEGQEYPDLSFLADAICSCRALVGMRLHSSIFACACGTPFVSIIYKKPIKTLLDDWDYKYQVDVREISKASLRNQINSVLSSEAEIRKRSHEISDNCYRGQERALEIIATKIRNCNLISSISKIEDMKYQLKLFPLLYEDLELRLKSRLKSFPLLYKGLRGFRKLLRNLAVW